MTAPIGIALSPSSATSSLWRAALPYAPKRSAPDVTKDARSKHFTPGTRRSELRGATTYFLAANDAALYFSPDGSSIVSHDTATGVEQERLGDLESGRIERIPAGGGAREIVWEDDACCIRAITGDDCGIYFATSIQDLTVANQAPPTMRTALKMLAN